MLLNSPESWAVKKLNQMKHWPGFGPRCHTALGSAGSNSLRTYQVLLLFLLLFPFHRAGQCVKMHLLSDFDRSAVGLLCLCVCFPRCGRGGPLSCRGWHWLMRFINKSVTMVRKLARELPCHGGVKDDLYLLSKTNLRATRACPLLYINNPMNNLCI